MLYGMATMYEVRGEYRKAESIVHERLALDSEAPSVNVVESHELLACTTLHQGRYTEAVEHGERALNVAEGNPILRDLANVTVLVQSHGWVSGALVFIGRPDDAVKHNDVAIQLAEAKGDELARASALTQAAYVRFYRREPEQCRRLASMAEAVARERRLPFHLASARSLLGRCLSQDGA
jgi:tetratricopeptide (TPR) repeat protein